MINAVRREEGSIKMGKLKLPIIDKRSVKERVEGLGLTVDEKSVEALNLILSGNQIKGFEKLIDKEYILRELLRIRDRSMQAKDQIAVLTLIAKVQGMMIPDGRPMFSFNIGFKEKEKETQAVVEIEGEVK